MDPDIKRRIGRDRLGNLKEPGARNHHRAAGDETSGCEVEECQIGAMAHPEIVNVQYRSARQAETRRQLRL